MIEDDAQDGGDHVDAHRSIAFIVGPYVKQKAVVSTSYNTVNMVRTIEEVLGLDPVTFHRILWQGLKEGQVHPANLAETRARYKKALKNRAAASRVEHDDG